jgi:uncharacterized SAM-binding protein YcdF (DUF218 family)
MFHVKHLPSLLRRAPERRDAIVVLGCVLLPGGVPTRALRERLEATARLYSEGLAPLVVVTGGRRWHGVVEAEAMSAYLSALGVPFEAIVEEGRSRTTRENARLSVPLLKTRGVSSVLIVTQPTHLRRAVKAFTAMGLDARGVLIWESYQFCPEHLMRTGRDVAREVGARVVDLVAVLRGRYP